MTGTGSFFMLLSVLAIAACAGEVPIPEGAPTDLLFESEHFQYYAEAGTVCDGLEQRLEQHHDVLTRALGIDRGDEPPVRFFWSPDGAPSTLDELGGGHALCQTEAAACAVGRDVFSPRRVYDHELVHAFLSHLGHPPALFTEGLAVLYDSRDAGLALTVDRTAALEPVTDDFRARGGLYPEAGSFVAFLRDEGGPDVLLGLYDRLSYEASAEETDRALVELVGDAFDPLLDAWASGPPQRLDQIARDVVTCSLPPVWDDETSVTIDLAPTCGDVPPSLALVEPARGQRLRVPLSESTFVRARSVAGDPIPGLRLVSCDSRIHPDSIERATLLGGPGLTGEWLELPADDYALYLEWGAEDEPPPLQLDRRGGLMGARCDDVVPVVADPGGTTWRTTMPERYPDGAWVAFQVETPVQAMFQGGSGALDLCTGSCDALLCQPVDGLTVAPPLSPGITWWLRSRPNPDSTYLSVSVRTIEDG